MFQSDSSQTGREFAWEKGESQDFSRDLCFGPVGMITANFRLGEFTNQQARLERLHDPLLTCHGEFDLYLQLLRGRTGVTEGHTRKIKTKSRMS